MCVLFYRRAVDVQARRKSERVQNFRQLRESSTIIQNYEEMDSEVSKRKRNPQMRKSQSISIKHASQQMASIPALPKMHVLVGVGAAPPVFPLD